MRRMKTLLTVLVSFVMLLVFSSTAFAAPTSVTVTVPSEMLKDHTFVAYQIFSGNQEANSSTLTDVEWGSGIKADEFLAALKATETSIADFSSCSTAAEVAKVLGGIISETDAANSVAKLALANIKGNGTALSTETTELESGYYLIVDTTSVDNNDDATNAALLQVTSNIEIQQKTDKPSVEKKVQENNKYTEENDYGDKYNDVADYNIGDSVPFKLIGTIPNMTHYESYSYTFHDTFSTGLTFNNDVKVYLSTDKAGTNKVEITSGFTTDNSKTGEFTVSFANLKTIDNIGNYRYILIEYTATLNENAVIGLNGNTNTVWLTYSNKPDQSGEGKPETGKTPEDTVIVFTYELDTTKIDGEDKTPLKDAEFKLKNEAGKWVTINENGKVTGWVDTEEDGTTLKSDVNGLFKVIGLDAGTYFLKETKAPSNYNQLVSEIKLTISATTNNGQTWTDADATKALTALEVKVGDTTNKGNLTNGTVGITIENNKGTTLPATGGFGTTMFYMIGGLLMLATAILLITKRRMNAK